MQIYMHDVTDANIVIKVIKLMYFLLIIILKIVNKAVVLMYRVYDCWLYVMFTYFY